MPPKASSTATTQHHDPNEGVRAPVSVPTAVPSSSSAGLRPLSDAHAVAASSSRQAGRSAAPVAAPHVTATSPQSDYTPRQVPTRTATPHADSGTPPLARQPKQPPSPLPPTKPAMPSTASGSQPSLPDTTVAGGGQRSASSATNKRTTAPVISSSTNTATLASPHTSDLPLQPHYDPSQQQPPTTAATTGTGTSTGTMTATTSSPGKAGKGKSSLEARSHPVVNPAAASPPLQAEEKVPPARTSIPQTLLLRHRMGYSTVRLTRHQRGHYSWSDLEEFLLYKEQKYNSVNALGRFCIFLIVVMTFSICCLAFSLSTTDWTVVRYRGSYQAIGLFVTCHERVFRQCVQRVGSDFERHVVDTVTGNTVCSATGSFVTRYIGAMWSMGVLQLFCQAAALFLSGWIAARPTRSKALLSLMGTLFICTVLGIINCVLFPQYTKCDRRTCAARHEELPYCSVQYQWGYKLYIAATALHALCFLMSFCMSSYIDSIRTNARHQLREERRRRLRNAMTAEFLQQIREDYEQDTLPTGTAGVGATTSEGSPLLHYSLRHNPSLSREQMTVSLASPFLTANLSGVMSQSFPSLTPPASGAAGGARAPAGGAVVGSGKGGEAVRQQQPQPQPQQTTTQSHSSDPYQHLVPPSPGHGWSQDAAPLPRDSPALTGLTASTSLPSFSAPPKATDGGGGAKGYSNGNGGGGGAGPSQHPPLHPLVTNSRLHVSFALDQDGHGSFMFATHGPARRARPSAASASFSHTSPLTLSAAPQNEFTRAVGTYDLARPPTVTSDTDAPVSARPVNGSEAVAQPAVVATATPSALKPASEGERRATQETAGEAPAASQQQQPPPQQEGDTFRQARKRRNILLRMLNRDFDPEYLTAAELGVPIAGADDWVYDDRSDMYYSFERNMFWDPLTTEYYNCILNTWQETPDHIVEVRDARDYRFAGEMSAVWDGALGEGAGEVGGDENAAAVAVGGTAHHNSSHPSRGLHRERTVTPGDGSVFDDIVEASEGEEEEQQVNGREETDRSTRPPSSLHYDDHGSVVVQNETMAFPSHAKV